jgi:C4-dicarboxylate transporter, DctQ subunit
VSVLKQAHDQLTRLSLYAAMLCLAFIASAYCIEVVLRYFFDAPTTWVNPFTSYALCLMIFLALPEMTREGSHLAINILVDKMSADSVVVLMRIINLIGLVAALAAAWITGTETVKQYVGNIFTMAHNPIPKWIISIAIPYGFGSAALYFLRHLLGERVEAPSEVISG